MSDPLQEIADKLLSSNDTVNSTIDKVNALREAYELGKAEERERAAKMAEDQQYEAEITLCKAVGKGIAAAIRRTP